MRICKGIVLSLCIVLCVFPFISFSASEVTVGQLSGGLDISANTASVGGNGTFTNLSGFYITEGSVGNIKSGTITLTAPTGFEFDTNNPATVTVTSNTSNQNTNINHLPSGTIAPTVTTAGAISFTVTSQSTSARNTLTWNSVRIRPTAVVSISNSNIVLSSTGNIVGLTLPMTVGVVSELYVPTTLSSITITTPATKLDYIVGDTLDITGLVVTGTYSDGSTKTETINESNVTGFDSSVAVIDQVLTVTVDGKTTTYTVDISTTPSPVGTIIQNVTINTDTIWNKSGSPYTIKSGVNVITGTLTIKPGVSIVFESLLNVEGGSVVVEGTKSEPVNITGNKYPVEDAIGFKITNNSEFYANWISCTKLHICILEYGGGKVYVNHGDFSDMHHGISYGQYGVMDVKNSYFRNGVSGLYGDYGQSGDAFARFDGNKAVINVEYNYFDTLRWGAILVISSKKGLVDFTYKVENNTFKNASTAGGVFGGDVDTIGYIVGANYYGDPSGPLSDANPTGLGTQIYYGGNTKIQPWLTAEILPDNEDDAPPNDEEDTEDPEPLPTCCSSVMFFPGIEGSRLYMKKDLGIEDQLWEPNTASDVVDLYANSDGTSINDIYTRDIIKETNLVGDIKPLRVRIYKAFSDDLDTLVSTDKIHEWQPVPYDWRMSVDDIVNGGVVLENDTNNIIAQVERMAHDSDTGKVNLVGHSNGGLMIKYLVKRLEDKGEANLVDNVVFVGSPELGTPKGAFAVLNGIDFDGFFGVLAPQKYNKKLALNIAGAYALIPSEKFFENNITPVIQFDISVGDFAGLIDSYGNSIDTYQELRGFMLSNSDDRSVPGFDDINMPAIGNEDMYNKADSLHTILDNYTIPSPIKIYEISGTGIPTVSGIKYSKNKHCLLGVCTDRQFLVPEVITTVEGDKVVLNRSSAILGGTRYFVDMNAYNTANNTNYDHAYMLQNNSVKTLVENIVTGTDNVVPYVVDKSVTPTIKTKRIGMHSPVNISVYDSQGRHTGPCVDPEHPDMVCVEEEIPNSSYLNIGDDTYINIPGEGVYTLQLDGYDTGTFTLNIDDYENDTMVDGIVFTDIPTTADTTSTIDLTSLPQELLLDTNNDNDPDIRVDSNSQTKELHPKVVAVQIIHSNNGGRPVIVVDKTILEEKLETKKPEVPVKKKSAIIKKPIQVVKKQTPTTVAVANAPYVPVKPIITHTPVVIPMTANVGSAINFDLWTYLKELFNY